MPRSILLDTMLLLLTAMLTPAVSGATRHALVIGLGEYADPSWSVIHGDRDADLVAGMLRANGYTSITVLKNRQATKKGIVAAFSRLVAKARHGDIVYIHFSGHGQQVTDVSGDEDDGFDEAWIPYDARMSYSAGYKGENHLLDDEVALWMTRIRSRIGLTGRLIAVVDACHSGDSSRDCGDECYIRGTADDFIIPLKTPPARTAKPREQWLTLTACRDYQVNYEVKTDDGTYCGMLTYALLNIHPALPRLDNAGATGRLQTFVDRHRRRMPQNLTLSGDVTHASLSDFFRK